MHYNDLDEIRNEFKIESSDVDEIKKRLRQLLQNIHPDKNNGNFKNESDKETYDKIITALEFIETPKALTIKTELTALTKIVTELIKTNKSTDNIQKYETELSKKVEKNVKLYQSSHLFPKITSSILTGLITFIWLSPKAFADNPILSKYLSSSSVSFTIVWLFCLIFTGQLWYSLYRREQREQALKSNLNLENTQNQIFHDFIKWKIYQANQSLQIINFNKSELIDFIMNLRINRGEMKYEPGLHDRNERINYLPFPILTGRISVDVELAQSLSDLIVARAEKKGIIELEKSKSLSDQYKMKVDEQDEN